MTLPEDLNASTRAARLSALRRHVEANTDGINDRPFSQEVNNHVHTTYSFSPYSPTAAAWMARASVSVRSAASTTTQSPRRRKRSRRAGSSASGSTTGCEVRVNFTGTAVEGRRINNPDSPNLAYIVFHGVPAPRVEETDQFLAPIRQRRNERNRKQTAEMSRLLEEAGGPAVSSTKWKHHPWPRGRRHHRAPYPLRCKSLS